MVKSRTPPALPTMILSKGLAALDRQFQKGEALVAGILLSEMDYDGWCHATEQYLKYTLGAEHDSVYFFRHAGRPTSVQSSDYDPSPAEITIEFKERTQTKLAALKSIIQGLAERLEIESPTSSRSQKNEASLGDKIFIVHGHNSEIKEATARLISQLGLNPIILHEQDDKGLTIIEKLEHHTNKASYAIVLITGDDVGRSKLVSDDKPRARQNVILELGLCIGILGRDKVRMLCEEGVELPSDYLGVLHTPYDRSNGSWKSDIVRELRAAGFKVSLDSI